MPEAIEIIFKGRRLDYFVNPERVPVSAGDHVIVEAERGIDMGRVAHLAVEARRPEKERRFRSIIRRADEQDFRNQNRVRAEEREALKICRERIQEFKLEMKLLDAESQVDGNRITFFFTAEQRVDFRELVKDLAGIFKTRIELRQIGARDAAKRIGGLGPCGREYCCATWLKTFSPVTLKMAKNQGMSLSPSKISGGCGRLMCCLTYEDPFYKEMTQLFPKVGTQFVLDDKPLTVSHNDIFREVVIALDADGSPREWSIAEFPLPRDLWDGAVVGKGAVARIERPKPSEVPSGATAERDVADEDAETEPPPPELLRSIALTRRLEDEAFAGDEPEETITDDEPDLSDAELVAAAEPDVAPVEAAPEVHGEQARKEPEPTPRGKRAEPPREKPPGADSQGKAPRPRRRRGRRKRGRGRAGGGKSSK